MRRLTPERWAPPVLAAAAILALWELAGRLFGEPGVGTPVPSAVVRSLFLDPGFYLTEAIPTFFEAVAGLFFAVAGSVVIASCFALWVPVRRAFLPLVIASQTVPLIAVAPLLASVIGEGLFSRVVVTAWLCWFPVVVTTTHGMMNVDQRHLALFETYAAKTTDIFWKLRVPSAAPSLVAGVRAAAGFALIGAIVVEYSGAEHGLGAFLMAQAIHPTDATRVFGVVLVSSMGGLLLTESAHALTRAALARFLPTRR